MKRVTILTVVLAAWAVMLPAQQVTREQADTVVKEYLQSEGIDCKGLCINVKVPNAAGVEITTTNEEIFQAEYACWAYYLKESEKSQCRYLFVKQDNGNLLEVIASGDAGQSDSTQWKAVDGDVGIVGANGIRPDVRVYPNPVNDVLTIECKDSYEAESVEIYDVMGRKTSPNPSKGGGLAPSLLERAGGEVLINVSHLPAGTYFLKINNQVYKFIKK